MKELTFIFLCLLASVSNAVCRQNIIPSADPAAFIDQGDGTFLDSRTMLVWSKCPVGMHWSGIECKGEVASFRGLTEALDYVNTNLPKWRIPSAKELVSIVDYSCSMPAARPPVHFSGTSSFDFWFMTSTPQLEVTSDFTYTECTYVINFDDGYFGCYKDYGDPRDRYLLRVVKQ